MQGGAERLARAAAGFTLVELVAVMAITGILAAVVGVFVRLPLATYQDVERRAALTDTADTAFLFLERDLKTALPNSVRVSEAGGVFHLEFLKTRTGGRYRADDAVPPIATGGTTCADTNSNGEADENVLAFGVADSCFTTLGTLPHLASIVPNGDFVVVYNLGTGITNADAYASGNATGGNKSRITAAAAGAGGENVIEFEPHTFTLESPARRFEVISGPVTYICDPAAGTLRRVSGYAIQAAQPQPPAGTSALIATGVAACTMTYDVANERIGIVSIWLKLADPAGGTVVSLVQQVQVSNES
jgi:MSHA biogenesis protein MshO